MANRSAHGRAAPYRRQDGRWAVAVELPPAAGRRRRKILYGRTQTEVLAELRAFEQAQDAGRPWGDARLTVGTYLRSWVTDTLPVSGLRPTTVDSYAEVVDLHLVPTLGHHKLRDLKAPHIRLLLAEKGRQLTSRGKPLSAASVNKIHRVLRTALSYAVRDELIARNPASLVQPPGVHRPPVRTHTTEELERVLPVIMKDRLAAMWLLMLATGLRKGEVLALRWDDFDLESERMTVSRSLGQVRGPADEITGRRSSYLVEGPVKTDSGERVLWLPRFVVDALRAHRKAQTAERLAAPCWGVPGRVFTSRVGTPIDRRNVNRMWLRLCTTAEVRPLRVHDLRHGAATILLKEGVPMRAIADMLGHARSSTTANIYAHVMDEVGRDGAARMQAFVTQRART
jgi:integrase